MKTSKYKQFLRKTPLGFLHKSHLGHQNWYEQAKLCTGQHAKVGNSLDQYQREPGLRDLKGPDMHPLSPLQTELPKTGCTKSFNDIYQSYKIALCWNKLEQENATYKLHIFSTVTTVKESHGQNWYTLAKINHSDLHDLAHTVSEKKSEWAGLG